MEKVTEVTQHCTIFIPVYCTYSNMVSLVLAFLTLPSFARKESHSDYLKIGDNIHVVF